MGNAEAYVEKYLVKKATEKNYLCPKFKSPGNAGYPDRCLIGNNYTIFIETKSDIGKLSKIQKIRIKEMKEKGAYVFVINSRESVDKLIKLIENNELKQNSILY